MSLDRREFLTRTLQSATLLSLGPAVPRFLARAAESARAPADKGTVMVVVQLAGGNDGLNTVVPYADAAYAAARPTLRIAPEKVLKIDNRLGLHPEMTGFRKLLDAGLLAVVQGVGYPNPHQGHFESMRVWQTARPPGGFSPTGWIGRAVDQVFRPDDPRTPAVYVGRIAQPFALNAQRATVPTVRAIDDCTWRTAAEEKTGTGASRPASVAASREDGLEPAPVFSRTLRELAEVPRPADPLLEYVQRSTLAALAAQDQIEAAARGEGRQAEYPPFQFAKVLQLVARLIRAELGVRIFYAELGGQEPGGFDTHAGQAANHGALLRQLSDSVAAFVLDLQRDRLLDRVLLMTFSEFGRTVQENGRRGTDHGSAAPVFLAGGTVRGGLLGPHPSLESLENGGLRHHTDFRRIYAAALETWLGFPAAPILGERFAPLEVLRT